MTLRIFWLDLRRNAAISMPIKQAAQGLITGRDVSDGILNMVEMAFRAHDPCYGCAVHTPPGQMPLDLRMYDSKGGLLNRFQRP